MANKIRDERAMIGRRLRHARERAHITVQDAAKALDVQPVAVERWERGAALPSLIEFTRAIEVYGVMASEVLFEVSPIVLSPQEAAELAARARMFSPALRSRVDCLLAMFARGREPVWRDTNSA